MDKRNFFVYISRIKMICDIKNPFSCVHILLFQRVKLRAGQWNYTDLSAPFWRFYWNAGPGAYVTIQGNTTHLDPDQCYLLAPNTHFAACNKRIMDQFFIHFLTRIPCAADIPGIYAFPLTAPISSGIAMLSDIAKGEGTGVRDSCPTAAIWSHLLAYLALSVVPPQNFYSGHGDPRIARAVAIMETRIADKIHNHELAARAGMNTNAFIRLFKTQTGATPQDYQKQKRLEKACLLLRFTRQTIEEIAGTTGFCDRYHFTRAFRRKYGMGPAAFRKTPS